MQHSNIEPSFYEVVKNSGGWLVRTTISKIPQFSSVSKKTCQEWKENNDKGIFKSAV